MNAPAVYYLLILFAGQTSPQPLGPMPEASCWAVAAAITRAAIENRGSPAILSSTCQRPRFWYACGVDGRPGSYKACPSWSDTPEVGAPDQK